MSRPRPQLSASHAAARGVFLILITSLVELREFAFMKCREDGGCRVAEVNFTVIGKTEAAASYVS